ncbi:MAG: choice-of-anchor J domain-containing protein, partial [Muribaculaceae bacterium]|nr:choice-of-anchor J domain-containing protein [Muribaculaceae bacterium]
TYGSISLGTPENDQIPSADGDDAFLVATQYEPGATLDFFTGKIDLTGSEHPALTLRHYKWSDADANKFSIYAILADGKTVELGTTDHSAGGNIGWNVTVCPLEKVKGQIVELAVSALFMTHTSMPFDALRIAEMPEYDLAATFVSAPSRIEAGKEFVASGSISNMGSKKAESYKVELLINDEAVASLEGASLASGQSAPIQMRHTLSPLASGTQKIQLRVNMDSDSDATNDVSPAVTPTLVESALPAVTDLKAVETPEGVSLSWTEPGTAGYGVKEAEDFEDAEAWTGEVDGWTMLDIDDQQIGTLEGASMPGAVAMRTHHSFFVFDSSSDDITYYNPALEYLVKGNSGSKSLVAMYILNPSVAQDDWAISPLLSGEAQTISFYARSFHPDYLDHLEVLYSTKDSTDPADFVSLCENGPFEVPQLVDAIGNAIYQQYEFKLPQGAKRFALRVYNEGGNGFMLMIDDVKFDQANKELSVDHYDVYRNGICINPGPVVETGYLDATVPAGTHTY